MLKSQQSLGHNKDLEFSRQKLKMLTMLTNRVSCCKSMNEKIKKEKKSYPDSTVYFGNLIRKLNGIVCPEWFLVLRSPMASESNLAASKLP